MATSAQDTLQSRFLSPAARQRKAQLIEQLASMLGSRLSTGEAVREQHGHGEASGRTYPPDAVVWPESTEEVSRIVAACAQHEVPVIAFGAGTSLEGHVSAPYGGICLDLSRMNQVLDVRADDADCVVQPGVTREQLNAYLRDTGLFFPVDPGANASIGGMVSTRASGTTTIRYGAMTRNVLALQVVLADGRIVRIGTRAAKSSTGYDLVRLLVGAEGTLGIITEITLRLYGIPEAMTAATCVFPDLQGAVDTVVEIIQSGVSVARMEFLDEHQIRACNRYSQMNLPEQPTLFLEFHGTADSIDGQTTRAEEIARSHGGAGFQWAAAQEERTRLWKARHSAYFAVRAYRPGCDCLIADVCVPISHLAAAVAAARADIDAAGLLAMIVGHVGDGNFHVMFMLDPAVPSEKERADRVYDAMIDRALQAGGTCTGEHGIGLGKRRKLVQEYGGEVVGLMHSIKAAWDPQGILNPGKIFLEDGR
ncbi:MAG TPA: FAD-linked oxidase C-terminal domain-containing protein [Povalibacter sp.]|uniref:FAD-binding oxidoreductase n=1 Tax=Povalibacter sp. TaxID=1962978 RepID=UPI002B709D56|nr:FAD-linked oxidase C-terminal domain-containing protein [Povalibacter sp.]HMN47201.1 FAD-linked oxidase C-terminal domain-containing protein [Povalibacter sp.]